jgi:putative FmdB family regulatory protein
MAVYEYRCSNCGAFEARTDMGAAPQTLACPTCGREARRAWTAPLLVRTPGSLARALARDEASRDQPEVVTDLPPKPRRRPAPKHPALPRLPEP